MSELLVSTENSIRYLTLNRPEKRNALNDELIAALKTALLEASRDENLCAMVIRGAGKDFCSGADLAALQKISESSYEENLEDAKRLMELFMLIRQTPIPVIAAVHGRALAGGAGLATACDVLLATRSAHFGYPEVKIGFVPAMVMAILRRNVSEKAAFELSTLGVEFDAERGFELGLVNRVIDDEAFETDVTAFVSQYAGLSRSAVAQTKKLLYRMDGLDFEQALLAGAEVNAEARMTEDYQKGIRRFLAK